jgi:hypothetical protein
MFMPTMPTATAEKEKSFTPEMIGGAIGGSLIGLKTLEVLSGKEAIQDAQLVLGELFPAGTALNVAIASVTGAIVVAGIVHAVNKSFFDKPQPVITGVNAELHTTVLDQPMRSATLVKQ